MDNIILPKGTVPVFIPQKISEVLNTDSRFKVLYGGRGSAKSQSVATFLLRESMENTYLYLCARQLQNSISDSVHKLLEEMIWYYKWSQYFKVYKTYIKSFTGSEFIFKGVERNISEIKSLQGVDRCWVEEAEPLPKETWGILIPTIRKENSQIIITFNPFYSKSYTYKHFGLNESGDKRITTARVNWQDNPFFPETLKGEMEECKKKDPEAYKWIWEGNPLEYSSAQIFKDCVEVKEFDSPKLSEIEKNAYFMGADWGFADPSTLIAMFVKDNCLYIEYEMYEVPNKIDDLPVLYKKHVPMCLDYPIYADSSGKSYISFMKSKGFRNMKPAKKGSKKFTKMQKKEGKEGEKKTYIQFGIDSLKNRSKIIIHPRCVNTIMEFNNYAFKVDIDGEVNHKIIVDKYNHSIDAVRYGHDEFTHGFKISDYL